MFPHDKGKKASAFGADVVKCLVKKKAGLEFSEDVESMYSLECLATRAQFSSHRAACWSQCLLCRPFPLRCLLGRPAHERSQAALAFLVLLVSAVVVVIVTATPYPTHFWSRQKQWSTNFVRKPEKKRSPFTRLSERPQPPPPKKLMLSAPWNHLFAVLCLALMPPQHSRQVNGNTNSSWACNF